MKKQLNKLTIKTDKIVSLSAKKAQQIVGGFNPANSPFNFR